MNNISEIGMGSDAYLAGHRDDGTDFVAENFYVSATATDGKRWRHFLTLKGCKVEQDEEGYDYFIDIRPAAIQTIEDLVFTIKKELAAGGNLNPAYWYEVQAAYGSEAYINGGWEQDQIQREKEEEGIFN